MKRTGFLALAAATAAVLLAGCVSGYQYREGAGDYYYGQPSVDYNDDGYGGYYGGYGYPGGWGFGLGYGGYGYPYGGYGYGGYGYPYGGYGYPYGGYGYPYYPPVIFVPGWYDGHHHHGGHDADPQPYRSPRPPRRIGGDGTARTPIMMPSMPQSRLGEPVEPRPRMLREPPPQRSYTLPPAPRTERHERMDPPRIQLPPRSTRDRDGGRSSDR